MDHLERALKTFYSSEEVLLSFEMYHPTRADMPPEIDYCSTMENYQRTRALRAEWELERYRWSYWNR